MVPGTDTCGGDVPAGREQSDPVPEASSALQRGPEGRERICVVQGGPLLMPLTSSLEEACQEQSTKCHTDFLTEGNHCHLSNWLGRVGGHCYDSRL